MLFESPLHSIGVFLYVWSSRSADCSSTDMFATPACRDRPVPVPRLTSWLRETGSTVLSHVSRLILHTQPEYDSLSIPRFQRWLTRVYVNRFNPKIIGPSDYVPISVYHRKSADTRPLVFKVARVTGAAFSGYTVNQLIYICFPHPLLVRWNCAIQTKQYRRQLQGVHT